MSTVPILNLRAAVFSGAALACLAAWRRRVGCRNACRERKPARQELRRRCQQRAELIDLGLLRRQLRFEPIDPGDICRAVSGSWRRLWLRRRPIPVASRTLAQGRYKFRHIHTLAFMFSPCG